MGVLICRRDIKAAKEFFMKKKVVFLVMLAMVLVFGMMVVGCPLLDVFSDSSNNNSDSGSGGGWNDVSKQTVIKVTGLTSYNGKYAYGGISMGGSIGGITLPQQIIGDTVDLKMINENLEAVSVMGSYLVLLFITETSNPNSRSVYEGNTIANVIKGTTTIALSEFLKTN
jgi:hypothetical protein